MANDHDLDLGLLFAESPAPAGDEVFVQQVTKRIRMRRHLRRTFKILLSLLAAIMAGLISLTDFVAAGSNLFAQVVSVLVLTPAGLVIGGGTGLFFFLRAR